MEEYSALANQMKVDENGARSNFYKEIMDFIGYKEIFEASQLYYFQQNPQIYDDLQQSLIPVIDGLPYLTRQKTKQIYFLKLEKDFEKTTK